jgi:hypothetical protein
MPNLTTHQMADALGCSTGTVSTDRQRGMPMHSAKAARAWQESNKRAKAKAGGKRDAAQIAPSGYMDARTARERAEAEAAQIRVLEARGSLVHRDKVRQEVARHLASLRESLLQIPARLQSVLAAEQDEAKVHDILQDELYQALAHISEAA